jgi:hypothetical protein
MTRDEEILINATKSVRDTVLDQDQLSNSAARVAERLGVNMNMNSAANVIQNCDDVQQSLTAYRAGSLPAARVVLIDSHLRDCGVCLRHYRSQEGQTAVDWSYPGTSDAVRRASKTRSLPRLKWALGWGLVPAMAVLACSIFVYKSYFQVPPGVRAEVQSVDGAVYLISNSGDSPISRGEQLTEGQMLRTSGGSHAVLRLSDGSTVEVNQRSVLGVGARGHDMTVSLNGGAVIVQAAKRSSGHLYVKTPDCRVAVTGTVFSVDSGIKGSRVGVLRGSVHVLHAGLDTRVDAGNQMTTSDNLQPASIEEQISWSHDREQYLPLMAQFSVLQHKLEQIPFPQARYSSDLLARVPADTLLYVSIPNLGDFLTEANQIFKDQLQQSPALQQWWNHGHDRNTAELDALVSDLHQVSQYLGDEVVVVGIKQVDNPGIAIIADVQKSGLGDFLKTQFLNQAMTPGLTVFDEKSIASVADSKTRSGGYALIREHEAVFSNSIATLKQINAQLNSGASGFADADFGKQITAAYDRGAGVILAADLHRMAASKFNSAHAQGNAANALEASGIDDVSYLIAEHREINGLPENHVNIQFSGTRQHVASWLAAPAPMGSLDFVTPNAEIVVSLLSKEPRDIADDLMNMTSSSHNDQGRNWDEAEAKLGVNFRDDLAGALGGDFLLSLDGPVLPTPSWKAVIEVHDSAKLERTLEQLTQSIREQFKGKNAHAVTIEPSEAGGQRFYSVQDLTSGSTVAEYTFADGYMIVAPTRALVMAALHAHTSGDSLARSAAFKALLPKDVNDNYSAIAYQNLGPVLTPLLSQLNGESAQAIRQLASDARPTAICAWGRDTRIEAASDSHLFGFDLLAIGQLMHPQKIVSGNKQANSSVRE